MCKPIFEVLLLSLFWSRPNSLPKSRVHAAIFIHRFLLIINSPDIVISCDTNFTQKRQKGQCNERNPPLIYSDTVFISEEKVKQIDIYMIQLRTSI